MKDRATLLPPPFDAETTSTAEIDLEGPSLGSHGRGAGLALVIEPFSGKPTRVPLPHNGAVVLGGLWARRHEEGRIAISDPAVSASHARIEVQGGRARIIDLGSRNGTWVGGARVDSAALTVGACAIVGRSAVALEQQEDELHDGCRPEDAQPIPGAIGQSPPMRRLASQVRGFAGLKSPVLIRGESGSGKEVVARALHLLSPWSEGPFHAVNLGALPRELAEAELFGHERGAFTGANHARAGYFELADGGTLLLDELGELPLDMQAKLLRVLETGEVRRLGARSARKVDVRVVAATWAALESRIFEGTFREDLFHRIAVLMIEVPPLRERRSDVPEIARALLSRSTDFAHKTLSPAAASRLSSEAWPGNVRELRNVLHRAAAYARGDAIEAADVARALTTRSSTPPPRAACDPRGARAMVKTHGTIAAAARAAGIPRETMRDWVRAAKGA